MILTDYYRFEKCAPKAKHRMDCSASTRSYDKLEAARATKATRETAKRDAIELNSLLLYLGQTPDHFGSEKSRKADLSLTLKSGNLSSVYVPDPALSLGYGDSKDTNDALLFVLDDVAAPNGHIMFGAAIEIFVARGQRNNAKSLYYMFADGALDEEMDVLRLKAQPEPPAKPTRSTPQDDTAR